MVPPAAAPAQPKPRAKLTNADRAVICKMWAESKVGGQQRVVDRFIETKPAGYKAPTRSTITGILKESTRWLALAAQQSGSRHRASKFPQLEEALYTWFGQVRSQNAVVNDAMLAAKGLELAALLKIPAAAFNASQGWLANFKRRCGIQAYTLTGEAGSADLAGEQ